MGDLHRIAQRGRKKAVVSLILPWTPRWPQQVMAGLIWNHLKRGFSHQERRRVKDLHRNPPRMAQKPASKSRDPFQKAIFCDVRLRNFQFIQIQSTSICWMNVYIQYIYIYGIWNMNEYDIWISFWNILEYVGWIWYMLNVLQQSKTQKCLINCFIWFINQLYLSQPEKSLKISSPACVRLIASWMMYADMHTSAMAGGEDRALW